MTEGQPASATTLMPVGAWVRIDIPDTPVVGFTYVDRQAGFSAQGWRIQGGSLEQSSKMIVRLPLPGVPWHPMTRDEVLSLGLELVPPWVAENYGPQPPAGSLWGAWRTHPKLRDRFLPDFPDDLQVLVHDGGPRVTQHRAEAVWVSATGIDGDVFRGRVLNQPNNLDRVQQGDEIQFVAADGADHPVLVTDKYLGERAAWRIHPCRTCGFSELFDAPSDLIRVVFPNQPAGATMSMFTAFCPLCGGVQGVESRSNPAADSPVPAPARVDTQRPWWRFWA